jgi:hypothetical protein
MLFVISQANVTLVWNLMHPFDLPPKQQVIVVSMSKYTTVVSDESALDAGPSTQPFVKPMIDCNYNF